MTNTNLASSIRQKLLNLANKQGDDFQLLLTRYANERLLYRLSQSSYKDRFVLKGATLFSVWADTPHRATRDVDLLGFGNITQTYLKEVFSALAHGDYQDGLSMDAASIQVRQIREDTVYGGLRVTFQGKLGTARVPLQVDVGIGDAHQSVVVEVPSILSHPAALLAGYEKEAVLAEKLEATVKLGPTNSRMKDFYDLATLGALFSFDGEKVVKTLAATFKRRNTALPTRPLSALLGDLAAEPSTAMQWKAFQRRAAPRNNWSLDETFNRVTAFAQEPLAAVASNTTFSRIWSPGGPWCEKVSGQ